MKRPLGKGVGVMSRCAGYKRDNTRCTLPARDGSEFCWAHDPSNAEQRSKNAAKAGRARTGGELAEVRSKLRQLADDVLNGRVDKGRASVASQVLGVWLRVAELERKVRVEEQYEARLEALEAVAAGRIAERGGVNRGAYRW